MTDEFVGLAITSQTDFRIVIRTSNNPQNDCLGVYINIQHLR